MMTVPAYRAHPIRNFFRNESNRWRRHPASALLRLLCRLSVLITIFALLAIVIDLLVKGIPHLTPELFSLKYTTENQSMLPAIINTLLIALVALLVAIPIGVGGAIYLAEYAKRNSPLVRTIRLTAETLQGIPSIIYGLFGMVFFTALRINLTLLSGALTLSLMVLPLILRTTEEALLSIPDSYREGSGCHFSGCCFGQSDHTCFGRRIICLSCITADTYNRCHIYDASASLADHLAERSSYCMKCSLQVCVQYLIKIFF